MEILPESVCVNVFYLWICVKPPNCKTKREVSQECPFSILLIQSSGFYLTFFLVTSLILMCLNDGINESAGANSLSLRE